MPANEIDRGASAGMSVVQCAILSYTFRHHGMTLESPFSGLLAESGCTNHITMKTAVLATISWLASPLAAGPLKHAVPQRRAGFTDVVSTNAIPMRKHNLAPPTSHSALHRRADGPARLKNVHDVYYSIDLEVGNQTVAVSVDTGSSDTWMVQEPYECVSFWFDPRDPYGVSWLILSVPHLKLMPQADPLINLATRLRSRVRL